MGARSHASGGTNPVRASSIPPLGWFWFYIYYTTPVVYFAVGDKVISNGLKSPIYRPQHTQLSFASLCMLHHTQLGFASWCMGRYTTRLRFVVYLMHTQLSFALWCIISKIHNSALPRVVYFCVSNSRQLKNIMIFIIYYITELLLVLNNTKLPEYVEHCFVVLIPKYANYVFQSVPIF